MAKLQASERYKLTKLIEAEYAKRALTDAEFAAFAQTELSIEVVPTKAVQSAREALELPSTLEIKREAGKYTIESRLAAAEKMISRLVEIVEGRTA